MTIFTEVDGVPTVVAPATGPMRAGLMFRVGRADETLARSGLSHLVEHLALHHLGIADYHYNGSTGASITHFHVQGSSSDVAGFLTGVCDALRDLPLQRLETERAVVQTEWRTRTPAPTEPLALWRHGAQGYGLLGYPELGLPMIGPDDLRQWVARFFTRDNAVLWIAGDGVPPDLRLRLPAGARQSMPPMTSALPRTPAYFASGSLVALDAVVNRSVGASVYAGLLERQLFRDLRQIDGLSYTATAGYEPLNSESAKVTALADALPDRQSAVLGGFVDALAAIRFGDIAKDDLEGVRAKSLDDVDQMQAAGAHVTSYAFNMLVGHQNLTLDELREQLRAVTAEQVQAVGDEVMESALMMVPDGGTADWAGLSAAPTRSTSAVEGQRFAWRDNTGLSLVVGTEGVSLADSVSQVTVRFDQVAALLAWPDGCRQLIGTDGIGVSVEPTLCRVDAATLARIDAAVPPSSQVSMPAREPHEIPQPAPPEPIGRRVGATTRRLRAWARARLLPALTLLGIVVAVLVVLAGAIAVAASISPSLGMAATVGAFVGVISYFARRASGRS